MNMEQKAVSRLVRKIGRLTDINDHAGAIIALGVTLPDAEDETKRLRKVKREHIKIGHLIDGLRQERELLYCAIMAKAKLFFTADEYRQIYAAF